MTFLEIITVSLSQSAIFSISLSLFSDVVCFSHLMERIFGCLQSFLGILGGAEYEIYSNSRQQEHPEGKPPYKTSPIGHLLLGGQIIIGIVLGITSFELIRYAERVGLAASRYFICGLISLVLSIGVILSVPMAMTELYIPYDYSRYQNSTNR